MVSTIYEMFIRVKCYDLIMCHNLTVQCNFVKYEKMSVYFHISWEDFEESEFQRLVLSNEYI